MSRFLPRREPAPDAPEPRPATVVSDSAATPPPDGADPVGRTPRGRPTGQDGLVRLGSKAWALVGIFALLVALGIVVGQLRVVVVPLILALFPAAVLVPPTKALIRRGVPPAAAALAVLLGSFALLSAVFALLAPSVASELDGLFTSLQTGFSEVTGFLEGGPFGLEPLNIDMLIEQGRERLTETEGLGQTALGLAAALVEGVASVVFGFFALFFYLKDGDRIAAWLRDLFPRNLRGDVAEMASRAWETVAGYIQGQIIIAFVDALIIGVGIAIVGVPLALPLAVLVFVGGLFPIVGAVAAGAVAVLVALATEGVVAALIVLAIVVVVQQVEGDVLAPIVFGRTLALHPLAVLAALTAGALLLGILGAFLAVPVAASAARAVGYVRQKRGLDDPPPAQA